MSLPLQGLLSLLEQLLFGVEKLLQILAPGSLALQLILEQAQLQLDRVLLGLGLQIFVLKREDSEFKIYGTTF